MRIKRAQIRENISNMCRRVSFSQTAVQLCEQDATLKQEEFLHTVFRKELEHREESRKARLLREAAFPIYKTIDGYDLAKVKFPGALNRKDLTETIFIQNKQNIVMYGKVGTGKTHLAVALGVKACSLGLVVRFFSVAELVVRLSDAARSGSLEKTLTKILKADLIILDEWGYVPLDKQGAQLLFRIISDSYERRSIIITTNLEFSKWGAILTDDQMAAAMIDRLAHHGHLLIFEGESYRMKNALMKQK
ncbi:MAG: IS21-like element helper ATPase IstB [Euryarchaeota archaeon]|nr:IS21-like element helper ATPase IstB [Euryarchaeota archaeon]